MPLPLIALTMTAVAAAAAPLSQTRTFHIDLAPAQAMPLFTAEGERRWAHGWDPETLSGGTQRGSVFRTRAHGNETTWIVTDYRPEEHRASYARLVGGRDMGLVDVLVSAKGSGSDVTVTYTMTALSEAAQPSVAAFLERAHFDAFIEEWRTSIEMMLRTAKR